MAEKEKQHAEIDREIDELLAFELKLLEKDRRIDTLEASHRLLRSKLEEARVIDELQSQQISNVSSYQPANFVERPTSPSKPLVATLFPLLGLMCGCGLALIRETGKKTLGTAAHVESKLGALTLSTIPFKLHRAAGLAELLNGTAEQSDCIQHGSVENLEFVSASAADWRGQLDLSADAFSNTLAEFQVDNDLVVVDLPPASRPDRTNGMIEYLDFVIIVIESDRTDEARTKRLLQKFSGDYQTIAIVLNKTRNYVPRILSRFISLYFSQLRFGLGHSPARSHDALPLRRKLIILSLQRFRFSVCDDCVVLQYAKSTKDWYFVAQS